MWLAISLFMTGLFLIVAIAACLGFIWGLIKAFRGK